MPAHIKRNLRDCLMLLAFLVITLLFSLGVSYLYRADTFLYALLAVFDAAVFMAIIHSVKFSQTKERAYAIFRWCFCFGMMKNVSMAIWFFSSHASSSFADATMPFLYQAGSAILIVTELIMLALLIGPSAGYFGKNVLHGCRNVYRHWSGHHGSGSH